MHIIGISGWSGNGKTTLLIRLIPALTGRGYTVSTIKHAHHKFDIDRPGKDSYRHREAGAAEVLVSSANRWALMHENRGGAEASLEELVSKLSPVDFLLVEGFKEEAIPKIEVWRKESETTPRLHLDPNIVAIATPEKVLDTSLPLLDLDNAEQIADFIVRYFIPQETRHVPAGE